MSVYEHRGYVAVFAEPLDRNRIDHMVGIWIEKFARVEQVIPSPKESATRVIRSMEDIMDDKAMSFRVGTEDDFAWCYISPGARVIETSSFPGLNDQPAMCLLVLVSLPGVREIVDEHNDKRLDELEAEGVFIPDSPAG